MGQQLDALHAGHADTVIAAWGTRHSALHECAAAVLRILQDQHLALHCLGTNRDGSPKHPVRLPEATPLIPYTNA